MNFNETFTYAGADVESVYGLITDQEFRTESCANQGSTDYTVTVEEKGDGAIVTVIRTQAADLPEFVKRLIGSTVKVKQTEAWGGPDADGTRKADVKVSFIGQPAEMVGTATLSSTSGGCEFALNGDVKASIPFIGKKIEPEIAKAITASLREEVEYGMEKL